MAGNDPLGPVPKTQKSARKVGIQMQRCPKCKSENVTLWMGGKLGMIYVCKVCGYLGPVVVEDSPDSRDDLF